MVLAVFRIGDLGDGYPTSISVGEDGSLWVAVALTDPNDNLVAGKVVRIDPVSGGVTATIAVGKLPTDTTVSPGAVWVANSADGTISRIDAATNTATTLKLGAPNGVGLAYGEGSVWLSSEIGLLLRIDPATSQVIARIPTRPDSEGVAVGGGSVWVANWGNDGDATAAVLRVDPATNQVANAIPVGANANFVAFGGGSVWVALAGERNVVQIDAGTSTVVGRLAVAGPSWGIAAADTTAWVVQPNREGLKATPQQVGTATRINF